MKTHYGIIGFGPVGRVFAAHLAAAGHRVSVFYRNPNIRTAMLGHPLEIKGELNVSAEITDLYSDMQEFLDSGIDIILICTKSSDSPGILKKIKSLNYKPDIIFLSCQNGLDTEYQISDIFGPGHTLRMSVNMGCGKTSENAVRVNFSMCHYLSLMPDIDEKIITQIADDFTKSGVCLEVRQDYRTEVFKKALLNSSLGSLCALTRRTMNNVISRDYMKIMVAQIVKEGIEIAQAMNIPINDEFLDEALCYLEKGGNHKPSILIDIENNKITENEYMCGKLAHYAEEYGVHVTLIPIIYNLIKTTESTK
ncbi:MAG: 2-dehydropantoate 2-reductase [Emcibacter sp.]|nr:2-dehydropantoate 2-reductase [Emcibacter sp.]